MRLLRLFGLLAALAVMVVGSEAMKMEQGLRSPAITPNDIDMQRKLNSMIRSGNVSVILDEITKRDALPIEVAHWINLYASHDANQQSALDLAAETFAFDILKFFLLNAGVSLSVAQKERAFDRAASQEAPDERKKAAQNYVLRLLLNYGVDGNSAVVRARINQKTAAVAAIKSAMADNAICERLHAIALSGSADGYDDVMRGIDPKEQLRRLKLKDTVRGISTIKIAVDQLNEAFLRKIVGILEQSDKDSALIEIVGIEPQGGIAGKQHEIIKLLLGYGANVEAAFEVEIKNHRTANILWLLAATKKQESYVYANKLVAGTLSECQSLATWINQAETQIAKNPSSKNVHADPGFDNFLKTLGDTDKNNVGVLSYVLEYGVDAIKKIVAPDAQICCIGDIHASLGALFRNLKKLQEIDFLDDKFKIKDPKNLMIFTGDYVSRGKHNVGVIYTLLLLVAANPGQVVLLRGNHEIETISSWARYGITNQFQREEPRGELEDLYGEKNRLVWAQIDKNFFQKLPYVCFLGISGPENKIEWLQCCHGGIEPVFDHTSFLNDKVVMALSNMFANVDYTSPNKNIAGIEKVWTALLGQYKKKHQYPFLNGKKALTYPTDSGFIWSEFDVHPIGGKLAKPSKYSGGLMIDEGDAAAHAEKLGIVGWIRGHQHDEFGLKIGGKNQWLTMLTGDPQQIGERNNALWRFKYSQSKVPVFTLSTASESDGLNELYDSFIVLETNSGGHAAWTIKVYEKKVKDKTPFWAPYALPESVYPSSDEEKAIRVALRRITKGEQELAKFDELMGDITSSGEERNHQILRRLRLEDPEEGVSALVSAGARANLEFIKHVWPYLEEDDKNWILIQSVKRASVKSGDRDAMIDFLVRDFSDKDKGAKGASLDTAIDYYEEKLKKDEEVQDQIDRLKQAKDRLAKQKPA